MHTWKFWSLIALISISFLFVKESYQIAKDHCEICLSKMCETSEDLTCSCGGTSVGVQTPSDKFYPASSSSLGFVVDVTGSMTWEISSIQKHIRELAKTNVKEKLYDKFVLTSFADDGTKTSHELIKSNKIHEIEAWVDKLRASGGGHDCVEKIMSGLEAVAMQVSRGSVIFLYTGAVPKDVYKDKRVKSLLLGKDIRLVFINSGDLCHKRHLSKTSRDMVIAGRESLLSLINETNGFRYDTKEVDVLDYLMTTMSFGTAFLRHMPENASEVALFKHNDCVCTAKLLDKKCENVFSGTDLDGVEFELNKANVFFDSLTNPYIINRAIDYDISTFVYSGQPTKAVHWLLVDLLKSVSVSSVYLCRRKFHWANGGDKLRKQFRKYSIGLSADRSVWDVFDWSKFHQCGKTYEGPPSPNEDECSTQFVCGTTKPNRYVSVYKTAVAGIPNILSITEVCVMESPSSGLPMELSRNPIKADFYKNVSFNDYQNSLIGSAITDNDLKTFITIGGREPVDHFITVALKAKKVVTQIRVYRRSGGDHNTESFDGLLAAVSTKDTEVSMDVPYRTYHLCDSKVGTKPMKAKQTFIAFYCHLEEESQFVTILKPAHQNGLEILEISELEVFVFVPPKLG